MNDLIQLRGELKSRKNPATPKGPQFPDNFKLVQEHVSLIIVQLCEVLEFFRSDKRTGGALVNVHYGRIVPKSGRIQELLSGVSCSSDESIRGSRFEKIETESGDETIAHVFTHFVALEVLERSIELLNRVNSIMQSEFSGCIDNAAIQKIKEEKFSKTHPHFKTKFLKVLHDVLIVRRIEVAYGQAPTDQTSIVSLYRTGIEPRKLLAKFGIDIRPGAVLDESMVQLDVKQLNALNSSAPYLIAMSVHDLCEMPIKDTVDSLDPFTFPEIPDPINEPIIGVIDTLFDKDAYFSEWVTTESRLPKDIPVSLQDKWHGTEVCSIIVDGPALNPTLDDGCGRFRVRHFGVATAGRFSSFEIIRQIRQIVSENQDIHVWNLSLGSVMEINQNAISPQAAALDDIQRIYDVIFVVAGTNVPKESAGRTDMLLGAPADSLNSLVVNAVNMEGCPASYTRIGPVLSFFYKPDICYYGGDGDNQETGMCVCNGCRKVYTDGTSFAAPWIARKMSYLIDVMHIKREIAKALIIDSAAAWNIRSRDDMLRKGYGLVPKSIQEIVRCQDDEIKFVITATAEKWETYNYRLPVPVVEGKHPYFARATLAYFPSCDRNQGVDYTITEMDVYIGPVGEKDGKPKVNTINNNKQCDEGAHGTLEETARSMFRKWDNVKHIAEEIRPRSKPRKTGSSQMWGIRVVTKDRRNDGSRDALAFGLVVTLKEMKGVNRFDDFVQACEQKGWFVDHITISNQLEIFNQAESEIEVE